MKDLPVTRTEMLEALDQNNLDKFFIEFRGYFSNHLLQACVALYNLNVSKEKSAKKNKKIISLNFYADLLILPLVRFSAFVEHYISQLEPASGPTRKAQDKGLNLGESSVEELKGMSTY